MSYGTQPGGRRASSHLPCHVSTIYPPDHLLPLRRKPLPRFLRTFLTVLQGMSVKFAISGMEKLLPGLQRRNRQYHNSYQIRVLAPNNDWRISLYFGFAEAKRQGLGIGGQIFGGTPYRPHSGFCVFSRIFKNN